MLISQRVIGSANDLSGSLSIGPSQLQLGPLGAVYSSAPPASNQSQKVHGFDHAYNLDPADANQPTLDVAATNVATDVISSGIGVDSIGIRATADTASAHFLLTDYPPFALGVLGLSASATLIHSESDASYVYGPDRSFLGGTASFGSLAIGGSLVGGKTLVFAGDAAADTILYQSPIVTITLDKQTLAGFFPPVPIQPGGPMIPADGALPIPPSRIPIAPNQITTDAIDIHFNNALVFGRAMTGDILVGVTSASIIPSVPVP